MKYQAVFPLKDKNKKIKCRLRQFLSGALRVKMNDCTFKGSNSVILIRARNQLLREKHLVH